MLRCAKNEIEQVPYFIMHVMNCIHIAKTVRVDIFTEEALICIILHVPYCALGMLAVVRYNFAVLLQLTIYNLYRHGHA